MSWWTTKVLQVGYSNNRNSVWSYSEKCTVTYLFRLIYLYKKWIKTGDRRWLLCDITYYFDCSCIEMCVLVQLGHTLALTLCIWRGSIRHFQRSTSLSLVFWLEYKSHGIFCFVLFFLSSHSHSWLWGWLLKKLYTHLLFYVCYYVLHSMHILCGI